MLKQKGSPKSGVGGGCRLLNSLNKKINNKTTRVINRFDSVELYKLCVFFNNIIIIFFNFWFGFGWVTQVRCKRRRRESVPPPPLTIASDLKVLLCLCRVFSGVVSWSDFGLFFFFVPFTWSLFLSEHATPFLPQADFLIHYPRKTSGNLPPSSSSSSSPCIPKISSFLLGRFKVLIFV